MAVRSRALALVMSLAMSLAMVSAAAPTRADKPSPSEAQKAEARARYERGLKLYEQGAFDAALVEMRRAYELSPSYKILYNLGLIHRQLNDHAAALEAFREYLAEGGKKLDPKRRAEVEKAVKELEPLVATVTIEVDVVGAEITIDDAVVGTSPLAHPVLVNAGKRKIAAKLAGKPAATRVLTMAGSDTVTVKLELSESKTSPPPTATTTTATTSSETPPPKRDIPWVAWGVTGALAAGAAITGVIALSSSSSLRDQRDTPNVSRDDLDAASSRTKTWAVVTDVLLVGTVVSAGVSTWLTFRTPPARDTAVTSTGGGWPTTVRVGVGPTGFAVAGSF
ncbi:MAG: hypothetical protein HYV09_18480 [Deltaproteobacteria bacterium]|nr:hypothetical protein [Deltaproteobacteria bacterium]